MDQALEIPHLHSKLPELVALENVLLKLKPFARIERLAEVPFNGIQFPLYGVVVGAEDKTAPCVALVGGVHGLERIGSRVVIAWMETLAELLSWDTSLRERLKKSRLVFMPIVNPVGIYLLRRSNGNHIDLMRNSPIEAEGKTQFLFGGHRLSRRLPWYRGHVTQHSDMEIEAQALCDFMKREVMTSRLSLAFDVHSGFGMQDQLWFPYAKTTRPPPNLAEIMALKALFDRAYPNHFYKIEPQSKNYTTHGDLWDYLFDQQMQEQPGNAFIPWTLEMGSWNWMKKNPFQIFSSLGAFNPIRPHRVQRTLRRHYTLFDFLHRAVLAPESWAQPRPDQRENLAIKAHELWYVAK